MSKKIKKTKKALKNLNNLSPEDVRDKFEKELKGKSIKGVDFQIWYDALKGELFTTLQASSNWSFSPDDEDAEFYFSIFQTGQEGSYFTVKEYLYQILYHDSSNLEYVAEDYGFDITDEIEELIEDRDLDKAAEKVSTMMDDEDKKAFLDEHFSVQTWEAWLKEQIQSDLQRYIKILEDKLEQEEKIITMENGERINLNDPNIELIYDAPYKPSGGMESTYYYDHVCGQVIEIPDDDNRWIDPNAFRNLENPTEGEKTVLKFLKNL